MPLALVFDVETTGLLPKTQKDKIPHIIQLSFALYDTDTNTMVETYDAYVKPSEGDVLEPFITNLTGITQEMLDTKGIPTEDAISAFYTAYQKADILVAHNLYFDMTMITMDGSGITQEIRTMFDREVLANTHKKLYCTMQEGIELCKIERTNRRGTYYKQPKLSELYEYLFGKQPENLHNSAVDVAVCLCCFLKMRYDIDATTTIALLQ